MADFADAHRRAFFSGTGWRGRAYEGRIRLAPAVTIGSLFHYPLKSGRGLALERAQVSRMGIAWDRQWMLVNEKGTFLSQRTHPLLARIVPALEPEALRLRCEGLADLTVLLDASGERLEVRVWDDRCMAIEQGRAAHEWVSEALGEAVRLVRIVPEVTRTASRQYAAELAGPIAFSDGYPFLVCNSASLAALNEQLPEPIPMERFRPNVVITGLTPWAEDRIESLHCEDVTLRLVKPCTRCSIPTLDHESGTPSTNPLPLLKRLRFNAALRGVTFGENAVLSGEPVGELRVGTPVNVTWRTWEKQPKVVIGELASYPKLRP